uniref:SFRICE_004295 n=1 Tax=Spodoptera frugiperda TaxID=7108 RepID=A0A2H1VRB0_SPOFR
MVASATAEQRVSDSIPGSGKVLLGSSSVELCPRRLLTIRGLSLLLQLCQNGRSLISARGTELCRLYSSVPLALINDRPHNCNSRLRPQIQQEEIKRVFLVQPLLLPFFFLKAMAATQATTTKLVLDRRYRRIYNPDEVATIEEFPYMAALLVNNELWCGGVIIDKDKVLTAAHCLQLQYNNRFFREYVKMLTVRVGSTNATSGGELLRVSEIFFHPNYKPQTLEFNYAVLKLHKNLTFGRRDPYIEKITFARDKVVPVDNKIMFLGWGSVLGVSGAGGQVLLQKVVLPVYDSADCQEIYGKDLVTRTNFCAGYITLPKNVCNHDAGGPAVMDGVLIGVLSFSSKRCDQADQPAVFSTVGAIATWLDGLGQSKVHLRALLQ